MKYLVKSLYVVLPIIICLVIHFIFWYGNAFKPIIEWEGGVRAMAVMFMMFAFVGGIVAAHDINKEDWL